MSSAPSPAQSTPGSPPLPAPAPPAASGLPAKSNFLHRFGNPWIGLVGSFFSIVAVPLALYFFWASQENRRVTFGVNPVRIEIVRSEATSNLRVFYGEKALKPPVTAAQIAIWNTGRRSVRTSDVLTRLRIVTIPRCPIVEAKLLKQTRDVVAFSPDQREFADGVVPVDWKILEQGDGALIQVIYEGAASVQLAVDGVIEGQQGISRFSLDPTTPRWYGTRKGLLFLIVSDLFLAYGLLLAWRSKRRWADLALGLLFSALLTVNISLIPSAIRSVGGPPFTF